MKNSILTRVVSLQPYQFLLRFSTKDRVLFAKRLAFLLNAHVSLLDSITLIRNQTTNRKKRNVYSAIVTDLARGQFLSTSLGRYQKLFGSLTINVIAIGERAGTLSENLTYLTEELTKREQLKSKVRSALIYPVFITITTLTVTSLLVTYIFPKILPIFSSLNIDLPLSTQILLWLSYFLKDWGVVVIIGVITAVCLSITLYKIFLPLQYATNWLLIKTPIAGNIIKSYNCANFCRTLNLNLQSGTSLIAALGITKTVTDNTLYAKVYEQCIAEVTRGQKIATTLLGYPNLFPDTLPQLLLIGESTGSLSNSLGYLAKLYETEVSESTQNLSSMIEPLLLITMGLLVGIIAISVITPIYEVTQMLGSSR